MDEKELLRKAFEYGEVPGIITYCFTELCPMKNNCIHYLASLLQERRHQAGPCHLPQCLERRKMRVLRPTAYRENGLGIRQALCRGEVEGRSPAPLRDEKLPRQQGTVLPI